MGTKMVLETSVSYRPLTHLRAREGFIVHKKFYIQSS